MQNRRLNVGPTQRLFANRAHRRTPPWTHSRQDCPSPGQYSPDTKTMFSGQASSESSWTWTGSTFRTGLASNPLGRMGGGMAGADAERDSEARDESRISSARCWILEAEAGGVGSSAVFSSFLSHALGTRSTSHPKLTEKNKLLCQSDDNMGRSSYS